MITGAGRGIGFAFARALAAAGAHVVINDLDSAIAETACQTIRDAGGKASPAVFDVTDFDNLDAIVDTIVADLGRLDILMNNAGILIRAPIEDHAMPDFNRVININLNAVYAMARACARPMRAQGRGRIINTGSVMSISSRPGVISYVAAKHGGHGAHPWPCCGTRPRQYHRECYRAGVYPDRDEPSCSRTPFEKWLPTARLWRDGPSQRNSPAPQCSLRPTLRALSRGSCSWLTAA